MATRNLNKTIRLDHITKIEGHASLSLKVRNGIVKSTKLKAFESARFFEGILKDRLWNDVSTTASRICGVCSQTHLITSTATVETAMKITPSKQTKILRELLSRAANTQSHVLHIYFLALPDLLNKSSALELADSHPNELKRALKLKKLANDLVFVVGGQEVHSLSCQIGGFSKLPNPEKLNKLKVRLKDALNDALLTVDLFSSLEFPDFSRPVTRLALKEENNGIFGKVIYSDSGDKFKVTDYNDYLNEYVTDYSNSKFVELIQGEDFAVGALSRMCVNKKTLPNNIKKLAKSTGLFSNSNSGSNPFMNNLAQAIEVVKDIERCIEILEELEIKDEKPKKIVPKAGVGIIASEAPRGTLIYHYEINKLGFISKANIITPTAQNLKAIETDVTAFVPQILSKSKQEIEIDLERLIRAYDPCVSCATHFLKLKFI